jgi:hypothetical protein
VFRINARHLLLEGHVGLPSLFRRVVARCVRVLSRLARSSHGSHVLAIGVPLRAHFIVIPHGSLLAAVVQAARGLVARV